MPRGNGPRTIASAAGRRRGLNARSSAAIDRAAQPPRRSDSPSHPGRILKREIEARGLSANALVLALRTSSGRITDILNGERDVSPETAMRLARYFGASARFWLNLQTAYDLLSPKLSAAHESRLRSRRPPPDARPFRRILRRAAGSYPISVKATRSTFPRNPKPSWPGLSRPSTRRGPEKGIPKRDPRRFAEAFVRADFLRGG